MLGKWIHHLLNPHCRECRDEAREKLECHNCDVLTQLLEKERANNARLIEQLVAPKVVEKVIERPQVNRQPIRAQVSNWGARQALLEAEDRKRAELIKNLGTDPSDKTEDIEEKLGVKNG